MEGIGERSKRIEERGKGIRRNGKEERPTIKIIYNKNKRRTIITTNK